MIIDPHTEKRKQAQQIIKYIYILFYPSIVKALNSFSACDPPYSKSFCNSLPTNTEEISMAQQIAKYIYFYQSKDSNFHYAFESLYSQLLCIFLSTNLDEITRKSSSILIYPSIVKALLSLGM